MFSSTMECGHEFLTKVTPPKVGEQVYCRKCGDYKRVPYLSTHWRVKCADCTYSRYLGSDKEFARRSAVRHAFKYVGHQTKLFQANAPHIWEVISAAQDRLPVEIDDDTPPY